MNLKIILAVLFHDAKYTRTFIAAKSLVVPTLLRHTITTIKLIVRPNRYLYSLD
jgi:hypothetical protein